ncbi:hypothetical protein AK812_SmicGene21560 [Symbiodinium microadriaticum]|uniref:Uncharacterized protein n=1 Tax=Symbiodinium microadriaticum TaxID=2951 RepID=A0A1Q9DM22_SYMMI|nr:hypothetical protein AK812_SmicGene21560 [Symbiodinium microadriaticum]
MSQWSALAQLTAKPLGDACCGGELRALGMESLKVMPVLVSVEAEAGRKEGQVLQARRMERRVGDCPEDPSSQAGPESLPPGLPQAQATRTLPGSESHLAVPKTPPNVAPQGPPHLPNAQKKAPPMGAKPPWMQQQQPATTVPAAPPQPHAAPDLAGGAPPPPTADASPKRKAPPLGQSRLKVGTVAREAWNSWAPQAKLQALDTS